MRPSDNLLRGVLRHMSADQALKKLRGEGYEIGPWRCNQMRKFMLEEGEAAAVNEAFRQNPWAGEDTAKIDIAAARKATQKLEDRICDLYARKAKSLGCSLETAALVLNYSPAQIGKMAA